MKHYEHYVAEMRTHRIQENKPESFSVLLVLEKKRYAVIPLRFTELCRS